MNSLIAPAMVERTTVWRQGCPSFFVALRKTWSFEPARKNMEGTAKVLEVSEAVVLGKSVALIGWTPQVMSRAMFREIIVNHRPGLLRKLLDARVGPVCTAMRNLPAKTRLKGRCWTEYFV